MIIPNIIFFFHPFLTHWTYISQCLLVQVLLQLLQTPHTSHWASAVLLNWIISQMSKQIVQIFNLVLTSWKPAINLSIHKHPQRIPTVHHHPHPNVKLTPWNQQRTLYVFLDNPRITTIRLCFLFTYLLFYICLIKHLYITIFNYFLEVIKYFYFPTTR